MIYWLLNEAAKEQAAKQKCGSLYRGENSVDSSDLLSTYCVNNLLDVRWNEMSRKDRLLFTQQIAHNY